jgi:hypothetical protein
MRNGVHKKVGEKKLSGGEGVLESEVERVPESLLIKFEQAGADDADVDALGLALGGLEGRGLKIAGLDQGVDGRARDGKELGDVSHLE